MSADSVTIIIPVFNREKLLGQTLLSLEQVKYDSLHIVLVDNGSTDGSRMVCEEYAQHSVHDVKVMEETRKGVSFARNTGMTACNTEWVYFFDSDDVFSPDFLVDAMTVASDADVVFLPTNIEKDGKILHRSYEEKTDVSLHILNSMLSTQSMLLRTDFLRRISGWNEVLNVWVDWELGVRILLASPRIAWCTHKTYHRIVAHQDSITGSDLSHNWEGKCRTMRTVCHLLQDSRCRSALFLRAKIVEGKTGRSMHMNMHVGGYIRMLGAVLKLYTRIGGRGAWRLAYFLLPSHASI